MPNRSKPYCKKENSKSTIADNLRRVIAPIKLAREELARQIVAARARADKLRDARLNELRAELRES